MVTITPPAPRLGTARTASRPTLGHYVTEFAEKLDLHPYPWQKLLSDVSMELVPRRDPQAGQSIMRLHAQYVGAMVGRQSGKSAWCSSRIISQLMLPSYPKLASYFGLEEIRPQHVVYTAQIRAAAISKWYEHVQMIEGCPELSKHIKKVWHGVGTESMVMRNGSTYKPITPNRTGARGLTLDLAIVDEALAHPLWLLGAIRPTMAQRDNAPGTLGAQFIVISNAGDDDSELLNRIQELGIQSLSDPDTRRVWMEWSADPEADPFDEATWFATMPTLGLPYGIDVEFLREEAATMREDQFLREYLCRRSMASSDQVIPAELWAECARNDVIIPADGLSLALDIRMDRMGASLVVCGAQGGYLPIEVVEAKQGLDWVLARTVEVAQRWSCTVAIDVAGPAANLIPSLEAAGVIVVPLAAREIAWAAATFYDNVLLKRIAHLDDFRLNDAVRGASRRAVGDRWAFDRRGHSDISPLVAASMAVWVVESGRGGGKPAIY